MSQQWRGRQQGRTGPQPQAAGPPLLYGPYVIDYTDIPHDGDKKDLWTPQVGDVLLRLFPDWQTVVQWNQGVLFLGQQVDGTVTPAHNTIAMASTGGIGHGGPGLEFDMWQSAQFDAAGAAWTSSAYVFHTADPIQIQLAQTGGSDPGAGHVELYALVARALAVS